MVSLLICSQSDRLSCSSKPFGGQGLVCANPVAICYFSIERQLPRAHTRQLTSLVRSAAISFKYGSSSTGMRLRLPVMISCSCGVLFETDVE
jgi:hypothetical protein